MLRLLGPACSEYRDSGHADNQPASTTPGGPSMPPSTMAVSANTNTPMMKAVLVAISGAIITADGADAGGYSSRASAYLRRGSPRGGSRAGLAISAERQAELRKLKEDVEDGHDRRGHAHDRQVVRSEPSHTAQLHDRVVRHERWERDARGRA